MSKMSYLGISFISLSLLISGCTVSGGFNKPSNTNRAGYSAILHPAIGECDAINSKLSVDEAASRIKRKFHFMTTDEMKSSPNGDLLLSSSDYGWSSTPGTHYMMKQAISQGRGGVFKLRSVKKVLAQSSILRQVYMLYKVIA